MLFYTPHPHFLNLANDYTVHTEIIRKVIPQYFFGKNRVQIDCCARIGWWLVAIVRQHLGTYLQKVPLLHTNTCSALMSVQSGKRNRPVARWIISTHVRGMGDYIHIVWSINIVQVVYHGNSTQRSNQVPTSVISP